MERENNYNNNFPVQDCNFYLFESCRCGYKEINDNSYDGRRALPSYQLQINEAEHAYRILEGKIIDFLGSIFL
jgi:hypothetical protein